METEDKDPLVYGGCLGQDSFCFLFYSLIKIFLKIKFIGRMDLYRV